MLAQARKKEELRIKTEIREKKKADREKIKMEKALKVQKKKSITGKSKGCPPENSVTPVANTDTADRQ